MAAESQRIAMRVHVSRRVYALLVERSIEGVTLSDIEESREGAESRFGLETVVSVVAIAAGVAHVVKMCLEIRKLLEERAPKETVSIVRPDGRALSIGADTDSKQLEKVAGKLVKDKK